MERDEFFRLMMTGQFKKAMDEIDRLTAQLGNCDEMNQKAAKENQILTWEIKHLWEVNAQLLEALKKIDGWFEGVIEDSPKNWLELGSIAKAAIRAAESEEK